MFIFLRDVVRHIMVLSVSNRCQKNLVSCIQYHIQDKGKNHLPLPPLNMYDGTTITGINYMRKIFRFNWWIEQAQLQSILSGLMLFELIIAFGYLLPHTETPDASLPPQEIPWLKGIFNGNSNPGGVITSELQYFNIYVQAFLIFIYIMLIYMYARNNKVNEEIQKSMNAIELIV